MYTEIEAGGHGSLRWKSDAEDFHHSPCGRCFERWAPKEDYNPHPWQNSLYFHFTAFLLNTVYEINKVQKYKQNEFVCIAHILLILSSIQFKVYTSKIVLCRIDSEYFACYLHK